MSCNIYPKPCNIYLKACNILCKHSDETLTALSGTLQGISNSLRGGMTKRGQKKGKPVRLPLMCQNLMVRSAPKWRGAPSCV